MNCHTAGACLLLLGVTTLLGGCAATSRDPPPTVAAQPPDLTTTEVIEKANGVSAPAAATKHRRGSAARYAPPELSTDEVRARSAAAAPPLDFSQRLDHAHDRVYTRGQQLVEATDHRFAPKDRELLPVPAAPFRLGLTTEFLDRSDGMDFDLDVDFDVALKLPNIEKRLRIFVTSNDLDEAPRVAGEDTDLRAGLRYEVLRFVDFDVGIKADLPPVAFMSLKWAREYQLGNWDFYPFAKLFAETDESLGYAAAVTFDRWSGRNLFRTSTYAKWRDDRDRTEWSQTLVYARASQLIVPNRYGSYLRATDIGNGFGVRLLASGEDANAVTYYEAGLFVKRPTRNRWLYWYVEPLVRWDRTYDWDADAGIRLGIDMLFWDLARH